MGTLMASQWTYAAQELGLSPREGGIMIIQISSDALNNTICFLATIMLFGGIVMAAMLKELRWLASYMVASAFVATFFTGMLPNEAIRGMLGVSGASLLVIAGVGLYRLATESWFKPDDATDAPAAPSQMEHERIGQ